MKKVWELKAVCVRWEGQKVGDKEVGPWLGDGSDGSVWVRPAALAHQPSGCETVSCYGARGSDAAARRSGERAGVRAGKHLCDVAGKAERSPKVSTPKQAWSHCLQLCGVPAVRESSCAWLQLCGDPAVLKHQLCSGSSCAGIQLCGGPQPCTPPAVHGPSCAPLQLCTALAACDCSRTCLQLFGALP